MYYPLDESRAFAPDTQAIAERITPRTRAIILNPPHNPTGGVATAADLAHLAELAQRHDLWVVTDEVYGRVRYDGKYDSIAALPGMADRTFIVDGFSKTYAMTGWRLGYGVMPVWLANAVNMLTVNSNSCTASFTQRAGLAALTGPQDGVASMVVEFRRRRDGIVKRLNEIPGFTCLVPSGAFYAFPNVTGTGMPSKALADLILNEAGVACLNGGSFGQHGDGYLRFSYANSLPNILEAMDRIRSLSSRWT